MQQIEHYQHNDLPPNKAVGGTRISKWKDYGVGDKWNNYISIKIVKKLSTSFQEFLQHQKMHKRVINS